MRYGLAGSVTRVIRWERETATWLVIPVKVAHPRPTRKIRVPFRGQCHWSCRTAQQPFASDLPSVPTPLSVTQAGPAHSARRGSPPMLLQPEHRGISDDVNRLSDATLTCKGA